MVFVYIMVLAAILLFWLVLEKNLYNPVTLFSATWLFVGALSFMNLYSFNKVSNDAYIMAMVGVACFSLGGLICKAVGPWGGGGFKLTIGTHNKLRYGFLIPFFFFIVLFTAMLASRSFRLLRHGTAMEVIRFNYSSIEQGIIIRNAFEYDVEHYIVATAEFAGIGLLPVVLMDEKSWQRTVLVLLLVLFFGLHIFVTGARSFVFDIVFALLIYVLMDQRLAAKFGNFFRKIPKLLIRGVVVAAVLLFVGMTQMRRGGSGKLVHEVYSYFAMCFRLLDTHLKIMRANPDYTYGMTLLNGVFRPVFLVLRAIGIPYPAIYTKAVDLINANNVFYAVGKGSGNSFVTVFYYFYMDFGYIGVILGCFLYGFISQAVYACMQRCPDKRNQALYLLVATGVFLTFVRLHFSATRYAYAFPLLLMCFRKDKTTVYSLRLDRSAFGKPRYKVTGCQTATDRN